MPEMRAANRKILLLVDNAISHMLGVEHAMPLKLQELTFAKLSKVPLLYLPQIPRQFCNLLIKKS